MKKVAWIGAGVMGQPMAGHLAAKGYDVSVYARKDEVLEKMRCDYGVENCYTSIAEAVKDAEVVFVMVGYPADVEEVFLGEGGLFDSVKPGTYIVDMTTSNPSLAVKLYEMGKEKGIHVLDAPVSGGDKGAQAGTLAIMVGGDEEDFEAVKPMFEAFGKSINYMGGAGYGQHTKAANQICVAGATAAYTEAIVYAQKVGLDPEKMLEAIGGGAAGSWQITNMAPRALKGDFAPGFFIKHFVKDMKIVQEEAADKHVQLQMLDAVLAMYEKMVELGFEDDGTQALIKIYRQD